MYPPIPCQCNGFKILVLRFKRVVAGDWPCCPPEWFLCKYSGVSLCRAEDSPSLKHSLYSFQSQPWEVIIFSHFLLFLRRIRCGGRRHSWSRRVWLFHGPLDSPRMHNDAEVPLEHLPGRHSDSGEESQTAQPSREESEQSAVVHLGVLRPGCFFFYNCCTFFSVLFFALFVFSIVSCSLQRTVPPCRLEE